MVSVCKNTTQSLPVFSTISQWIKFGLLEIANLFEFPLYFLKVMSSAGKLFVSFSFFICAIGIASTLCSLHQVLLMLSKHIWETQCSELGTPYRCAAAAIAIATVTRAISLEVGCQFPSEL